MKKEIDERSLHEYMWYGYALGSNTLFKGIYKLLPGNYMKIQSDKIEIHEYWTIQNIQEKHEDFENVDNNVLRKVFAVFTIICGIYMLQNKNLNMIQK